MILTDGVHLVSDTSEEELHAFAERLGMKREWYQKGHYDLLARWRVQRALENGAVLATRRECVYARRRALGHD